MPVDGNIMINADGRGLEYIPVSDKMKNKAFKANLNDLSNI